MPARRQDNSRISAAIFPSQLFTISLTSLWLASKQEAQVTANGQAKYRTKDFVCYRRIFSKRKSQLLKEKIMHECVKLLLGSLDTPQTVPDDESIEAAAKLFFTIGKQLESPASSKAKLDASNKLGVI